MLQKMETNYLEKLETWYKEEMEGRCSSPPNSRLDFLGDFVFDFTTYDGSVSELFSKKMIEVLECILNGTTFEYQKDKANYINYLTFINMQFLKGKLEWGTSIRGAWFDEYGHLDKQEFEIGEITVPRKELKLFIKAIIEFSNIKD